MKMTERFLAMTILTLGLMSPPALASGADMQRFFTSAIGYFSGEGLNTVMQADGTDRQETFSLRVDFSAQGSGNWEVKNERRQNSVISNNSFVYGVRGEKLLVGQWQPTEPVTILESTPTSLSYKMTRYEAASGRVYDYIFVMELVTPQELRGDNLVQLNGVTIREDKYTITRW
jgi:hypothetical protein